MLASVSLSPSQDKARATTHMWLLTQFGLHIKTIETTMPTAITHEKWHFHPIAVFFTSHWTDSMNNAVCRQLTWSKSKSQSELVISCRQQLHNFIKIQIIQSINLWSHNPIRFCGRICTELTLSLHSWNELLQWRVVRITAPQALMLPHSYAQHQMQPNVTDTARSIYLSVCLLVTTMSPTKMAEPIKMPL